jgi:hypothetical protein
MQRKNEMGSHFEDRLTGLTLAVVFMTCLVLAASNLPS